MLVVLPFYSGDAHRLVKLLEWLALMDRESLQHHSALLWCPFGTQVKEMNDLALKSFGSSSWAGYDEIGGAYPQPHNNAWQSAARHIASNEKLGPWLWLESDAVPIKPGWLAILENAHKAGGKPFSGHVVGEQHMTGVGIYPNVIYGHIQNALLARSKPFDIVAGVLDSILPKVHRINDLIQHTPDVDHHFNTQADVDNILHPETVLFHKCKDGSLIDRIRERLVPNDSIHSVFPEHSELKASIIEMVSNPALTVVITNWKRPEFLWEAFRSCQRAEVERIVISSSSATEDVKAIHKRILNAMPSAIIISEDGDSGCNVNWLNGVKETRTSHVTILHDDDLLMPDFKKVKNHLKGDHGFILWSAHRHGMGYDDVLPPLNVGEGAYPTPMLYENLLKKDGYTISPTSGCFLRSDLIRTLNEAQDNFGDKFFIKPTMMVGNDLLIWLRAIQRHKVFKYLPTPMVSYGHHPDSTTCDEVFQRRGKLGPIYADVRKYFMSGEGQIIHAVSRYDSADSDTTRRVSNAEKNWNNSYANLIYKPLHVRSVPRESSSVGCEPGFPFLKDVLKAGLEVARDIDIVMLTNDDTLFHPTLSWRLLDFMRDRPCATAFRVEFRGAPPDVKLPIDRFASQMTESPGRDLFAFRPAWLRENWDNIPDYLLGHTDWDSTLAVLMRISQSIHVTQCDWLLPNPETTLPKGIILHEAHAAPWALTRMESKANRYNRYLTNKWIEQQGIGWHIG